MYCAPISFQACTNTSPRRSTAKSRVRKVAAGSASFSRSHAEQVFSVCRISKTLSRARRIFWPVFPMAANSSGTRSLGASHPTCPGLTAELHGLMGDTLTVGVSHGAPESGVADLAAYLAETGPPNSIAQGARPADTLARGSGSAASRMKLTACGNDGLPERFTVISVRIVTARILL